MTRLPLLTLAPAALLALSGLVGCGGVSSYAVPTAGPTPPPRMGPVTIFAARQPTEGRELGVVETKATGADANVEVLFPELVRRAQELGGNAVVLDTAGARFELVETWQSQTTMFPCGYRQYCSRWDSYPQVHEQMWVVLRGRAWLLPEGSSPSGRAVPAPAAQPAAGGAP